MIHHKTDLPSCYSCLTDYVTVCLNASYYLFLFPFKFSVKSGKAHILKTSSLHKLVCLCTCVAGYFSTVRQLEKYVFQSEIGPTRDTLFYFKLASRISGVFLRMSFQIVAWFYPKTTLKILQILMDLDKIVVKEGFLGRNSKKLSYILAGWSLLSFLIEIRKKIVEMGSHGQSDTWSVENLVASVLKTYTGIYSADAFSIFNITIFTLIAFASFNHMTTFYVVMYAFSAFSITVWYTTYAIRRHLVRVCHIPTKVLDYQVEYFYQEVRRLCNLVSEVFGHIISWMLVYSVATLAMRLDSVLTVQDYAGAISGIGMIIINISIYILIAEVVVNVSWNYNM